MKRSSTNSRIISRCKHLSCRLALTVLAYIAAFIPAKALPTDFYAPSSRLVSGRWAKIEVASSGMQFISNATLKNLGFANPENVNVYGFGGRMLPERLDVKTPDDLPIIPSLRTPTGIVFFGHGNISWEQTNGKNTTYTHILNPYSDKSFYFLSDAESQRCAPGLYVAPEAVSGESLTTFIERIAHEKDLLAPSNTGRLLLGEDFRTQNTRQFDFPLPGNTGDATVNVCFGAYQTNGTASLMMTANGEKLPSTSSDMLRPINGDRALLELTKTIKTVEDPGDKLSLSIQFTNTGALVTAALDYIEVEYERLLRLTDGQLYFYISPTSPSAIEVEGCTDTTVIWDVTDPAAPLVVDFTLKGTTASFNTESGYHEFVAFNPDKIAAQALPAGRVSNQDIHGMEIPDMVVISPDAYLDAARRLADLHAQTDGLKVAVLTPEAVYNEFSSGTPDLTAFRRMLKMWYDRGMASGGSYTRYCLLFGRPSYDTKMATPTVKNAGYPRIPIWQSTGTSKSSSYSTDDYIGMLEDQPGVLNMGNAKIHVAVGRMPVKSVAEANTAITKLEKYVKEPNLGAWRNNVMIIADDQDNAQHMEQAEKAWKAMRSKGNGADFLYEKLYLDAYTLSYGGTGPIYPEAKQRMMDKLAEGVGFINYIGHANTKSWGHEQLLTWNDITSMSNTNLPFIYAATCEFMRWDDDEVSGAEELWLNPTSGVIGMICPSREVYIYLNGILNQHTSGHVFDIDSEGNPMRVGDIMISGKNDFSGDSNKLRYGLIGDPAMSMLSPSLCVSVDSIADTAVTSESDMPVIPARASVKISGRVTDRSGNLMEDFDGFVQLQIFDAEKAVETNGNGKDGKVYAYNDRKTRLYTGRAKASGGVWQTTVTLPSEIENNFSPALISLYAYDGLGREANGSSDRFYVYGYDENAPDDDQGPEITELYLNSPSFAMGDAVSPSPVLFASFSDESGINVSDAGIGHRMTLSIDNEVFFNDVNLYYTADIDNHLAGSIAYPLQDIEPGDHELKFTVWDNANNSTSATLLFKVAAAWTPDIAVLSTDVNPASSYVNFIVGTDGASGKMDCRIEVFGLDGRLVWDSDAPNVSSGNTTVRLGWNLCDHTGVRVPRGIYLYRATVTTAEGAVVTKTKKLAVTAP